MDCGQLADGRVLHYQQKKDCRRRGGSNWMKMKPTKWEPVDLSKDFAPLAADEVRHH